MSVLVVLESSREGTGWHRASLDAAVAGKQIASALGLPLAAAVLGSGTAEAAAQAEELAFPTVYRLEHSLLAHYTPEAFVAALEQLIQHCSPQAVIFPHTYQVRDYAPRLAARYRSSLIPDIIGLKTDGDTLCFVRQLFSGRLLAKICPHGRPVFVSVQAGAFPPPTASELSSTRANATMERVPVVIKTEQIMTRPEPPFRELEQPADLQTAKIIVSVGRGVRKQEDLKSVELLTELLGGQLAASRPVCDSGWVPMNRLVGSSGQSVTPPLYLAIGISGAIQHLLGIKGAKTVAAINIDGSAPIFEIAQYGIIGDFYEVVPALIDELRKSKS